MILPPIGKLYGLVMEARNGLYDRGIFKTHPLGARTISIGNLTAGGTGKTPLVALAAKMLIDAGEKVCILTRGYGRANPNERVLVSDGTAVLADANEGGDEPVELALQLGGQAVIVADADRVSAGRWAREEFGITTFVLDDGFQHRRVRRDLDIVCIDATDPCGGGRVMPAGRLRERFAGSSRADAIVLTRSDLVDDVSSIEKRLRRHNASAPIFKASTRIEGLIDLDSFHARNGSVEQVTGKGAAFCALGNPAAFFKTLERYFAEKGQDDARLLFGRALRDHHSYTQANVDGIGRLAKEAGADLLVTTAKDAVKLKGLRFSLPCYVAIAETAINDPEAFRRLVTGE